MKTTLCTVCGDPLTLEHEQDQGLCVDCDARAFELEMGLERIAVECPVIDVFDRARKEIA